MRMRGCVIRACHIVYPLSDEPEWHGLAWIEDVRVAFCVCDYLNKRLRRVDQVGFSFVVPEDGTEWVIAEEEAEEVEWSVMQMDPQLSADFYSSLSPAEVANQTETEVRYHLMAIRAAIQFESLPSEDLDDLVESIESPRDRHTGRDVANAKDPAARADAQGSSREIWIRADEAARNSGLSADSIRKRATREGWKVTKSGQMNCYRLEDLQVAWPNKDFSSDNGRM